MMKLLVLIHEANFPHHVMEYILQLGNRENILVEGIFIENANASQPGAFAMAGETVLTGATYLVGKEQGLPEEKSEVIRNFESFLVKHQFEHKVISITDNFLGEIVDRTAFSDLLICDDQLKETSFSVGNLVSSSHCPVLLVPEKARRLKNIIFAYDGKISSIYAMKQFNYLFPGFNHFPVTLFSVIPENVLQMEDEAWATEWMKLHYPDHRVVIRKGEVRQELAEYINEVNDGVVVMGAFGRSALSRLFRESIATSILQNTQAPIFIAHS